MGPLVDLLIEAFARELAADVEPRPPEGGLDVDAVTTAVCSNAALSRRKKSAALPSDARGAP